MRKLSILQRLTILISVSSFLVLTLEAYFIHAHLAKFCAKEFKARILSRLSEADSLLAKDPSHPFLVIQNLPPGTLPEEQFFYATDSTEIIALNGQQLPLNLDSMAFKRCALCYVHLGKRDYGILHDSSDHHTLVLSAIDRYGQSKLLSLRYGLFLGILLGVSLLSFLSWFWLKKMLQPIATKINTARNIGVKNLNLRLEVKNDQDELGQLGQTFNEMLGRIEQGFQVQQEFIRNASHEIRTPLTAISAAIELALQQKPEPENLKNTLESIQSWASNLNDLVAQLLLMAKVETSNTLNLQACASDDALMAAIKTLHLKYPTAKDRVKLQIEAKDLAQLSVHCDPVLLQAAFFNLLDNAMKYGDEKPFSVRLMPQENWVCLEVTDQGQGISPPQMEHLFEPFYRIYRANNPPGSGIGLSLVKSIVDKSGGKIELHSIPGEGTSARLYLPQFFEK